MEMDAATLNGLLVVLIVAGLIVSNTAGRKFPPVRFFSRAMVWALCGVLAYWKAPVLAYALWGVTAVFVYLGFRRCRCKPDVPGDSEERR